MRKLTYLLAWMAMLFFTGSAFAQAPQKMSFQSVFRDGSGQLAANQVVGLRISILRESPEGPVVYAETHQVQTNTNGLASLVIGEGIPETGIFSAINWSFGPYFLQSEVDLSGGTNYLISGTHQLLSVPYALYAKTAENGDQLVTIAGAGATTVTGEYPNFTVFSTDENTTYQAGNGIEIIGTTISNTTPDQPIILAGAGATTVTGTYPNFIITSIDTDTNTTYEAGAGIAIDGTVINNTAPDQEITLIGAGTTTVTGTYPQFTITSTGGTVNYTGGPGIEVNGTTIINTAPDQEITLSGEGTTTVTGSYPDFTITSTGGTVNYTEGAGIDISGTVISNTAPDQEITLTGQGATTVTGAYPNFTITSIDTDTNTTYEAGAGIAIDGTVISNTAPDQVVTLSAGPGLVIQGSYPDYTVSLEPDTSHYIGELFGGGIVFYTYDNGQHGLIASLTDLGTVSQWHTGASNTAATSYYDGAANNTAIVSAQGMSGAYAALLCKNYTAGGVSDWYLPSIWELNLLFQNGFMVSYKLQTDGNPGTSPLSATESYWSSTQFNPELAYMVYFPDGTPYLDFKYKTYRVRAVRRF